MLYRRTAPVIWISAFFAIFASYACDESHDLDANDDDQGGDSDSDGDSDGDGDEDDDDDNDDNDTDSDTGDDDDGDDDDDDDDDNNNDDSDDTCGNGQIDSGEVCDGDEVPCETLNPDWVDGDAACLEDCSAYDESACQENIDIDDGEMAWYIQRAAEITGLAHMEIFSMDWIGKYERDIKSLIGDVFDANGASGLAFSHIVASGPNALDLHYTGGDRMIVDGDLVEVDIGAKYEGWCGDITRTFPANGKFSDRQKELYQLVLDVQLATGDWMENGVHTLGDATAHAKELFKQSPLTALDMDGNEQTMDVFFIHGISHFIGKTVHGTDLDVNMSEPPPVGYVFSMEPGLYIESEGTGMRTEDDFVMTENGAVNIWKNTIKTVKDIEDFMAKKHDPDYVKSLFEINEEALPALEAAGHIRHMDF